MQMTSSHLATLRKGECLKISSDEPFGGPLGVAAGEIDRANAAIKRARPVRYAGVIETGIENVFEICSRRATIVNS